MLRSGDGNRRSEDEAMRFMRRTTTAVLAVTAIVVLSMRDPEVKSPSARSPSSPSASAPPDGSTTYAQALEAIVGPQKIAAATPYNTYLTGRHLHDDYQKLRESAAAADVLVADRIFRDCFINTRVGNRIRKIIDNNQIEIIDPMSDEVIKAYRRGEMSSPPRFRLVPARPAQIDAAREIAARCQGFEAFTSQQFRPEVADLAARMQRGADPLGIVAATRHRDQPWSPEALRAQLDTQDPTAIGQFTGELLDRWQRFSKRPISEMETHAANQSLDLIRCDLGNACGPDSMIALISCLYTADDCGLDFPAQVMRREAPDSQRMIEDDRVLFLDAIRSGHYALWGL